MENNNEIASEVGAVRVISKEERLRHEIALLDPVLSAFDGLNREFDSIEVKGKDDKDGYESCKKFLRTKVKQLAKDLEDKRKDVKGFYLEAGREIDSKAKEIKKSISLLENSCMQKMLPVQEELNRIEKEKKEKLERRMQLLTSVNYNASEKSIAKMNDKSFQLLLADATIKYEEFQKEQRELREKAAELEAMKNKAQELEMQLQKEKERREKALAKAEKVQEHYDLAHQKQKLEFELRVDKDKALEESEVEETQLTQGSDVPEMKQGDVVVTKRGSVFILCKDAFLDPRTLEWYMQEDEIVAKVFTMGVLIYER